MKTYDVTVQFVVFKGIDEALEVFEMNQDIETWKKSFAIFIHAENKLLFNYDFSFILFHSNILYYIVVFTTNSIKCWAFLKDFE